MCVLILADKYKRAIVSSRILLLKKLFSHKIVIFLIINRGKYAVMHYLEI